MLDLLLDTAYAIPDRFPWSRPSHGVQHCGSGSPRDYWATVEDYGSFAVLSLWSPGCAFHPEQSTLATADEARTVGRRWVLAHNSAR